MRRLNRYSSIVIDSDRSKRSARINDTKRRVRQEFDSATYPGFAWVTECRTIENHIPLGIFREALSDVYPKHTLTYTGDKYDNPLALVSRDTQEALLRPDKVRIARAVCDRWTAEAEDLHRRQRYVKCLVEFIRQANGLSAHYQP